MNNEIKNIVFDVGMVLIDFCWEKHCRALGFSDEIIEMFRQYMIQSEYWDLMDEGLLDERQAIRKFIENMPQYEKEIREFWKQPECFVEEYDYAVPVIKKLKERGYQVYLLSNYPLNMYKLHWPSFTFYSIVDGYIVSAVEKLKKPDEAIYQLLCRRYRLKPEECLFIDDKQVNVEAASHVGMQSILFRDYSTLKRKLDL